MQRIFIVIIVLSAAMLGCRWFNSSSGTNSGPTSNTTDSGSTSSKTESSSTAGANPRQEIVNAGAKFIALPSFSAKVDATGNQTIQMQMEYAAPDRIHLKNIGKGGEMESIYIGKDMYLKSAGKWRKLPGSMPASFPDMRDAFTEEGLKSLSAVKFEGASDVNGKPAWLYSYSNETDKSKKPVASKIWIGKESGLPMKITVDYADGEMKQMAITYDTETPVTIEAPIEK